VGLAVGQESNLLIHFVLSNGGVHFSYIIYSLLSAVESAYRNPFKKRNVFIFLEL
jgi:hypothetical protein